jgi:hypothetical protein
MIETEKYIVMVTWILLCAHGSPTAVGSEQAGLSVWDDAKFLELFQTNAAVVSLVDVLR